MAQVILDQVSLAYGIHPLLDQANLTIEPGERLCLVGRNGAGKSSLMKIITQETQPDSGIVRVSAGIRLGWLDQDFPDALDATVTQLVETGAPKAAKLLAEYHQLADSSQPDLTRLQHLQAEIEAVDGWALENKVKRVLSRLHLNPDAKVSELSGGWRRRVLLAKALVEQPDILLLDEPTNHLDVDAIEWLEQFLLDFDGTLIFVSHDRRFIDRLATRIVELDRGNLTSFPGNYQQYLSSKAKLLEDEANQNALFDKKLAEEETWIRQGIKARRTRNEGRVRALKALREERKARRDRHGKADFNANVAERSGKTVFEIDALNYEIANLNLVSNFTSLVERGDKIALIGPNGIGKSTLIKLLLGSLDPNSGEVKQGTKLQVAYFDQTREQLDPDKNILDTVSQGRDQLEINGQSKHIYSYLQDFLFTPERARTPIKALSGGERNRVLLARIFTKPFNVLVMDEPTNDMDLETLELLEEMLLDFSGTLLLVSHDRQFVDAVATQSWVFEGEGKISEWVGGYSDWQQMRKPEAPTKETAVEQKTPAKPAAAKPKKLSYKVKLELERLPEEIEQLEQQISDHQAQVSAPDFYQKSHAETAPVLAQLSELEQQLETKMERWVEIESMLEDE